MLKTLFYGREKLLSISMKFFFYFSLGTLLIGLSSSFLFVFGLLEKDLHDLLGDWAIIVEIIFFISILALWLNGWKKLIKGWKHRDENVNIIFLLGLIFFALFAAYFFYFFEKNEEY